MRFPSPKARPAAGKGFTLLEILLVIAAIGILAGIVILAINPGRQLAAARNSQRQSDVNTILNAVYQYALDNNGQFPPGIHTSVQLTCNETYGGTQFSICKTAGCTGVDMVDALTQDGKYLTAIPTDPSGYTNLVSGETTHSGYFIMKEANGRITVCAPQAENDVTISVTR